MKNKKIVLEKVRANKNEFIEFLTKYNVLQLAVGVVLGTAAKDLVTSLANNLIMPVVGLITPEGSWRDWAIPLGSSQLGVGQLMSSFLDFLIVAIVVFVVVKKILKIELDKK
jgi:large conductance mechanosensitive channel